MKILHTIFAAVLLLAGQAQAAECIVPSKPGGAMDLTCKLAQKGLATVPGGQPMKLVYRPGGIGAVAWHSLVSQRGTSPNTLVAFSGGSLLNLAQGKFGKVKADDVRWVAALGADYGMIAVRSDSPYKSLTDLVAALKRDPSKVLIGVSGTVGSQDWLKVALLVRQAGMDPKVLRFVALEGGGEAFTAMQANHVQVMSGDASEVHLAGDSIRVLAVMSEERLPGKLSSVPTAREQGYDIVWPVIRGLWMGPKVSDADYQQWVKTFEHVMATPEFARLRTEAGFFPFSLTGQALNEYVHKAVEDYGKRASQLGLMR